MKKLSKAILAIWLLLATVRTAYADIEYVVQAGDTIFSIGRHFSVSPWAIITANHLNNPNRIYPGQVLVIPGATGNTASLVPTSTTTDIADPTSTPSDILSSSEYVVQRGDSLYRI